MNRNMSKHTLLPCALNKPVAYDRWCRASRPAYARYLERREQVGIDTAYAEYLKAIAPFTEAYDKAVKAERREP